VGAMLGGRAPVVGRLRIGLGLGAMIWLGLLVGGFVAPDGWTSLLTKPGGIALYYMTSLWLVTLVASPLLACRDPLGQRGAMEVYVLGVLAVLASTLLAPLQAELPAPVRGGVPVAAALTTGFLIWAHW
jgi:hypothetical protein